MVFGSAESQVPKLINREIRIPTRVITVHQRHRRTDRRTTYHGNTALRYASRGKNELIDSAACGVHNVSCEPALSQFLFTL